MAVLTKLKAELPCDPAVLLPDRHTQKLKAVILHNEKRFYRQEDVILNVYATNNRPSRQRKQKLRELNREIDKSTVTHGDSNTPFLVIDTSRQKISKVLKTWTT